jgi:hypothetical protein
MGLQRLARQLQNPFAHSHEDIAVLRDIVAEILHGAPPRIAAFCHALAGSQVLEQCKTPSRVVRADVLRCAQCGACLLRRGRKTTPKRSGRWRRRSRRWDTASRTQGGSSARTMPNPTSHGD